MNEKKKHQPEQSDCKRKAYRAWQLYEMETNGFHSTRLAKIAAHCPKLTPTQLRVATLVTELLPNHEIARILFTSERAVEKVRSRIRKSLVLTEKDSLAASLISLVEKESGLATEHL